MKKKKKPPPAPEFAEKYNKTFLKNGYKDQHGGIQTFDVFDQGLSICLKQ